MKKNVMNIAAVNEIAWYNMEETKEKLNKLPLKMQWNLRKNMKALEPFSKEINDFREELIQKRNSEWFVEGNGKCETIKDKDKDGNEQELLRIIDKYQEEFMTYEEELNKQLNEILVEENEVELIPFDLEEFVEIADEKDTGITMDDVDMISLFEEEIEKVEAEVVEG